MLDRSDVDPHAAGEGQMLSWIRRIVGFGTRRPGYAQGLAVEQWLEKTFGQLGLQDVRREPVPVNYWEPSLTSLSFAPDGREIPSFALPYAAWTPVAGIEAPCAYLGEGAEEDFQRVDVRGRIAVLEARFTTVVGTSLKDRAIFVRDARRTIPDGPLPFARWIIHNFPAFYQAKKRGAVGFVGLLTELPVDGCDFYVPYDGFLKDLPAVWVGREHADQPRAAALAGRPARLTNLGEGGVVDSHNVLGVLPGTGRNAGGENENNENIVVTCHHDAPFASAVEDASGLAVLLALAKEFAAARQGPGALRRDLVLVASSGHFHGGVGNRVLVQKHAAGFLKRSVAAFGVEHVAEDVESDGRGGYALTGRPAIRALLVDGSPLFLRILEEEADRSRIDRMFCLNAYFIGPEPPCDSAPLFTAGIPSACHIAAPYYLFDPHDTVDKVCVADLTPVKNFFARTIRRVDELGAAELAEGMTRTRGMPPSAAPEWFRPPP